MESEIPPVEPQNEDVATTATGELGQRDIIELSQTPSHSRDEDTEGVQMNREGQVATESRGGETTESAGGNDESEKDTNRNETPSDDPATADEGSENRSEVSEIKPLNPEACDGTAITPVESGIGEESELKPVYTATGEERERSPSNLAAGEIDKDPPAEININDLDSSDLEITAEEKEMWESDMATRSTEIKQNMDRFQNWKTSVQKRRDDMNEKRNQLLVKRMSRAK